MKLSCHLVVPGNRKDWATWTVRSHQGCRPKQKIITTMGVLSVILKTDCRVYYHIPNDGLNYQTGKKPDLSVKAESAPILSQETGFNKVSFSKHIW